MFHFFIFFHFFSLFFLRKKNQPFFSLASLGILCDFFSVRNKTLKSYCPGFWIYYYLLIRCDYQHDSKALESIFSSLKFMFMRFQLVRPVLAEIQLNYCTLMVVKATNSSTKLHWSFFLAAFLDACETKLFRFLFTFFVVVAVKAVLISQCFNTKTFIFSVFSFFSIPCSWLRKWMLASWPVYTWGWRIQMRMHRRLVWSRLLHSIGNELQR